MDSSPDSDHVMEVDWAIQIAIYVYMGLSPELVLEKWSRVNGALENKLTSHITVVTAKYKN